MTNLDILTSAIRQKKPVSFEYNKPGKVEGKRIGNPHAVFIFTSKAGEISTKVHIVQTDGVSDSKDEKPFPDFRMFNIEDLSSLAIIDNALEFEPYYEKYNPEWEGYKDVIEKI
jgi:hypothetical protein